MVHAVQVHHTWTMPPRRSTSPAVKRKEAHRLRQEALRLEQEEACNDWSTYVPGRPVALDQQAELGDTRGNLVRGVRVVVMVYAVFYAPIIQPKLLGPSARVYDLACYSGHKGTTVCEAFGLADVGTCPENVMKAMCPKAFMLELWANEQEYKGKSRWSTLFKAGGAMMQWGNLATYENAHVIAACCLIAFYLACLGIFTIGPGNNLLALLVATLLLAVASMITFEDGKVPTEAWAASGTLGVLSIM